MKNADSVGSTDLPLELSGPIPGTAAHDEASDEARLRALRPYAPGEPAGPARESWWDRGWNSVPTQSGLWVIPAIPVFRFFIPDDGMLAVGCVCWFVAQFGFAYDVIHRVGRRRPPGDLGKAGAAVICSMGPWLLFIPFWDTLTAPRPLHATFLLIVVWGMFFRLVALDSWRPRWRPWFWTAVSRLAALTCVAGVGAGLWLVVMFWPFAPNPPQTILAILVLLTAIGLALIPLSAWGAARFWAQARQPSQAIGVA